MYCVIQHARHICLFFDGYRLRAKVFFAQRKLNPSYKMHEYLYSATELIGQAKSAFELGRSGFKKSID